MKDLYYHRGEAYLDGVSLNKIANKFLTPCYVYSQRSIESNYQDFNNAFINQASISPGHQICYAVKANSNLSILNLLSRLGSGFDIVSGGELERVLAAGGDAQKIIFSGVGKQEKEIELALKKNIYCFNVESESELERINNLAKKQDKKACIALRINPDINALTHPYIATGLKSNKFGIELKLIKNIRQKIKKMQHLKLIGLACHIGSQLVKPEPFLEVARCLHKLYLEFSSEHFPLQHINIGGGLGVRYQNENPPSRKEYISIMDNLFSPRSVKIILEPGRSIVADAGILLTRVEYLKETSGKNFAIIDASMNDLLRPALYQAWHDIIPLAINDEPVKSYDLVGSICESTDCLGQNRRLRLRPGSLLGILMTGAYGFSMSSNYNSRPRSAEVMIEGAKASLIRKRESIKELFSLEKIPKKNTRKK